MTALVTAVLDRARADLGVAEYPDGSNRNGVVEWYNANVDRIGVGPWCQMAVTRWLWLGGAQALYPVGRAYTVWACQDSLRGSGGATWRWGTAGLQPGDVVYFDWSGGRQDVAYVDHVGIVEAVLPGGEFVTIEGNIGNRCARVRRDTGYVVGYSRLAWPAPPPPPRPPAGRPDPARVKRWQAVLEVTVDGKWGPNTDQWSNRMRTAARAKAGWPRNTPGGFSVASVQRVVDTAPDGIWGPLSQAGLLRWVRQAQSALGVTVDGQWGPATDKAWAALRANNLGRY